MNDRLRRFLRRHASTLGYVAYAACMSAPAWIVRYPPIEDLPYHLATIRVIHDIGNAQFDFARHFELALGRTQYLGYYLLASALAYLVGVFAANVALMIGYLAGSVLALRRLLRTMHLDERACLFLGPFLVNAMFVLGLLPFLLGVPVMFLALAEAILHLEQPTRRSAVRLGLCALALFFVHVVPFALFGLAFAAFFPWSAPRRWLRAGAPVLPALLAALVWLGSPAGKITREASGSAGAALADVGSRLSQLPSWIEDVFQDNSDEVLFVGAVLVAALSTALARGDRERPRRYARFYAVVPIGAALLYFTTSDGHAFIWPLSQRFPALCALTMIPLLRVPRGTLGVLAASAACAFGIASSVNTCRHFIAFQLDEVGDFDDALATIPPRQRVAALIYDKASATVRFTPFLHFGSYYQLAKGGFVEFTFAGYPHWPLQLRPEALPPQGVARPRWEWTPESVPMSELYPYYDYVLARGAGFAPANRYEQAFRGQRWSVFRRVGP